MTWRNGERGKTSPRNGHVRFPGIRGPRLHIWKRKVKIIKYLFEDIFGVLWQLGAHKRVAQITASAKFTAGAWAALNSTRAWFIFFPASRWHHILLINYSRNYNWNRNTEPSSTIVNMAEVAERCRARPIRDSGFSNCRRYHIFLSPFLSIGFFIGTMPYSGNKKLVFSIFFTDVKWVFFIYMVCMVYMAMKIGGIVE